jgi:hypothetical protein
MFPCKLRESTVLPMDESSFGRFFSDTQELRPFILYSNFVTFSKRMLILLLTAFSSLPELPMNEFFGVVDILILPLVEFIMLLGSYWADFL